MKSFFLQTFLTTLAVMSWSLADSQASRAALKKNAQAPLLSSKRPKLVLLLVIDQFRPDALTRFETRFLPPTQSNGNIGGFRYLMKHSAYFPQGQYEILQSVTCAGHATIFSGSYPYLSGIPVNDWYDSDKNQRVYCVDDPTSGLIGSQGPIQGHGVSPRNFNATTVGDELKNAGYPSRVVSVALKDRAAILLAGQRPDLVFWYDSPAQEWVSSQYYLPNKKLPDWMKKLNQEVRSHLQEDYEWKSDGPGTGFSDHKVTGSGAEVAQPTPASFSTKVKKGTKDILGTPYGVDLTVTAAEQALNAYELGKHATPDVLAVSFSSHDIVGHMFGPNSRQMEEITVAEDRAISKLLNSVRKKVSGGMKDVVVVLTGDHGTVPNPDWISAHGMDAGRIDEQEIAKKISSRLTEKYGKPKQGEWVTATLLFNFYLNKEGIASKKLDRAQVEAEAKSVILEDPHAAYVLTSSEYQARKFPPGIFETQAMRTYYPSRSGDLILIPRPYYILKVNSPHPPSTIHMTGYSYDRTVPILISGQGMKPGVYGTQAKVVDIAPTLSFLLGIVPPSLSEGRVLTEALY